ncbi:MAG: hypothetical protein WCT04_18580 [Planctomycetota bacterium]
MQNPHDYNQLRKQAQTLSFVGNFVRVMIIVLIPTIMGVGVYLLTVGPELPWKREPIKSWIEGAAVPKPPPPDVPMPPPEVARREVPQLPSAPPLPLPDAPPPDTDDPKVLPKEGVNGLITDKPDPREVIKEKIITARDLIDQATKSRDLLAKKLKSAESWMPKAEADVNRYQAEVNTAVANLQARQTNGVPRGLTQALSSLQIQIETANRHLMDAETNYISKRDAVTLAQKNYDTACGILESVRTQMITLCKEAEKLTTKEGAQN